jgi:hypothetical protein
MKNVFFIILLVLSANAYECTTKSANGEYFTTMTDTFKDMGDQKSMWIQSKKIVKGKIVETSKQKIEIESGKMLRVIQGVTYDKNGNTKNAFNNGDYARFEEVIPGSMGEWMWHIITNGEYILRDTANDQKIIHNKCLLLGYNEVEPAPLEEPKKTSMTIEESKKWLEENDPRIKK